MKKENLTLPNVFDYAPSELSQDAMFAWILQWADPIYQNEDSELCALGQNFVHLLTGNELHDGIKKIVVRKQWNNIDLYVEINDDTVLIIEDKVNTTKHDNQIERYRQTVENNCKNKNQYFAYVKTGNEPKDILTAIAEKGYKTVLRRDLLGILRKYNGKHPLVVDYRTYLEYIEAETECFRTQPDWCRKWYAVQGFFMALENEKGICLKSWGYVPNRAGGFLGAWWHYEKLEENVLIYLQFENQKLCFKIESYDENRAKTRDKYFNMLMNFAKDKNLNIAKPDRFGSGTCMTIAVVEPEYVFGDLNKPVDLDLVAKNLRTYEGVIDGLKKMLE